ncbi:MAG TPA: hypothetical protein VMV81_10985 [Phycisphaerae bacterium]|nr:hypothetical protein [Phycisphaerae bacterium]
MFIAGIDPVALFGWGAFLLIFLIVMLGLKLFLSGRRRARLRFLFRLLEQRRLSVLVTESHFYGILIGIGVVATAGLIADKYGFVRLSLALNLIWISGSVFGVLIIPQQWVESFWNVVKASRFRICPECYYTLRGLGEKGQCPECGLPFDNERLEAMWRRLME